MRLLLLIVVYAVSIAAMLVTVWSQRGAIGGAACFGLTLLVVAVAGLWAVLLIDFWRKRAPRV